MSDLLRRQYDEMVSENATLQSQLAARDAEVARLREHVTDAVPSDFRAPLAASGEGE